MQQILNGLGIAERDALRLERKQDEIKRVELVGLQFDVGRHVQMPRRLTKINHLLHVAFHVDVANHPRRHRVNRQIVAQQPLVGIGSGVQIQRLRAKHNRLVVGVLGAVPNV